MNKKKLMFWSFLTAIVLLLTFSLISTTNFVAAADPVPQKSVISDVNCESPSGVFSRVYCVWLGGASAKEFDLAGEIIKWLFLVLIVVLIYSALTFASFPEGAGVRIIIAVVGGILATFLITTNELMTAVQSYSALGVALVVFFPILVLGFFTMVVATKANPIGILLQRILWLIFSVYLFLKAGMLFALSRGPDTLFYDTAKALSSESAVNSVLMNTLDKPMLILLLVVAIAVFFIAVVSNKFVVHWLAKEKVSGEIEAQKQILSESHAYDVARSEQMEKGRKL